MQINKNGWVQLPKKLLDDMDWHENDNLLFRQEKEGVFLHKEEKMLAMRCLSAVLNIFILSMQEKKFL